MKNKIRYISSRVIFRLLIALGLIFILVYFSGYSGNTAYYAKFWSNSTINKSDVYRFDPSYFPDIDSDEAWIKVDEASARLFKDSLMDSEITDLEPYLTVTGSPLFKLSSPLCDIFITFIYEGSTRMSVRIAPKYFGLRSYVHYSNPRFAIAEIQTDELIAVPE